MDKGAFAVLEAELRARFQDISRIGDRIEERLGTFAHTCRRGGQYGVPAPQPLQRV